MIEFADTLFGPTLADLDERIHLHVASRSRVKPGPTGCRISIEPKDVSASKNRAELAVTEAGSHGETSDYSWEHKVTEEYRPATPFVFMGQVHGGRNADGEVDENPPPIAMRHFADDKVDFVYGLEGAERFFSKKVAFPRGKFHAIRWRVYWSTETDGWAEVYLDGKLVERFRGANMRDATQKVTAKVGIYRHKGGRSSTYMIVRNWKIVSVAA